MDNLTEFQEEIVSKCLEKNGGCISVPMGNGKTLIALCLSLRLIKDENKSSLIICSKTLIENWIHEIKKFFGDSLPFVVLHKDYNRKIEDFKYDKRVKIYITTPQVLQKCYKDNNIETVFTKKVTINEGEFGQHDILYYRPAEKPFLNDKSFRSIFYSVKWRAMFIDEAQDYTNIKSDRSRAIASIYAKNRWCLSGTIFHDPKIEKILGYYLFIGDKGFPNSLPDASEIVRSKDYKGINNTLVSSNNIDELDVEINNIIVYFDMYPIEKRVYTTVVKQIIKIKNLIERHRGNGQYNRVLSASMLASITYLKIALTSPVTLLTNLYLKSFISEENSEFKLTNNLINDLSDSYIHKYLNDRDNIISSRIEKVLEIVKAHNKIVIFTVFRTTIDLLSHLLNEQEQRKILTLGSDYSVKKRGDTVDEFNESDDAIMLLTYNLGSTGLNLQTADTVLLVDYEWSYGITKQAIARVIRRGQKNKMVNVYYLTSQTAIEDVILEKQQNKIDMLKSLENGPLEGKVKKIQINDILRILENEQSRKKLEKIIS